MNSFDAVIFNSFDEYREYAESIGCNEDVLRTINSRRETQFQYNKLTGVIIWWGYSTEDDGSYNTYFNIDNLLEDIEWYREKYQNAFFYASEKKLKELYPEEFL